MSNEANFSMNFHINMDKGSAQVTVRGDTLDEFSGHIKELLAYLPAIETEAQTVTPPSNSPQATTSEGEQAVYDFGDGYMMLAATKANKPFIKVFVGPWSKFGAPFYDENIKAIPELDGWEEWDNQKQYGLPSGFTQVVIALNPKGTPRKVLSLR